MTESSFPIIDTDAAVSRAEDDAYGFAEIAQKLCPTILNTALTSGVVVGIEGPWGSGKTTLLTFLRDELEKRADARISIIEIAPWLLGNIGDLPQELFSQMATKLLAVKPEINTNKRKAKNVAQAIAQRMQRYGVLTSTTASALEFVGNFSAPIGLIGKALRSASSVTDKLAERTSAVELKRQLENDLQEVDHRFIVLIDDLDRLEPAQATEVLRLVKSVANFPNITFVMSYDRTVLSEAIENGLQVADGHSYIQKIVQVAFGMPFYEPFALRTKLKQDLAKFYDELGLPPLDTEAQGELSNGIDQHGSWLRTPRDVKAVINRMRLLFPSVSADTYFPDFVRLQLIQVLNPKLYDWLQLYLNERAVIENGDGRMSVSERESFGSRLFDLLPDKELDSPQSIWAIRRFIPGLEDSDEAKDRVFNSVEVRERQNFPRLKRLGSPFHYKFYFALASPSSVLSDDQMEELLKLAAIGWRDLSARLRELSSRERLHGRSWLVHAVQRLSHYVEDSNDRPVIENVALAMAEVIDDAGRTGMNQIMMLHDFTSSAVRGTVDNALRKSGVSGKQYRTAFWNTLLTDCSSIGWLVGEYMRHHLFRNGVVGDRAVPVDQRAITPSEVARAREILRGRLDAAGLRGKLLDLPDPSSVLFGWRDILGKMAPRVWVKEQTHSDEQLLKFLLAMRYQSISDRVYLPLRKSDVAHFIAWRTVEARLKKIEENADAPVALKNQVKMVRDALAMSRFD